MGASAETLELPLSTRVAMTQLDALVTAQTKATKALKDFFLTEEKGSAKYEENLIKHIVSLDKATQAVINQASEVNKLTEAHNKQKAALEAISNYEKQRAMDFINGANQMANAEANRFAIIHQGVQQQIADRQAERAAFERLAGKGLRSDVKDSGVVERGSAVVQQILAKNAALAEQDRLYERIAFNMAKGGLRSDYTESGVVERGSAVVQQILAKNAALAEQDRLYERIAFNMAKGGLRSDVKDSGVVERGAVVVQQILSENAALEQQERLRERIAFQMMSGGLQRGLHQDGAREGGGIEYIQRLNAVKAQYANTVQQAMAADDQWNTKQAQLNIQFIQLTRQIEVHNARIRELAASEVVDANAVEMEVRARDKLQAKLIQVDRSLSTSNAAMRNARMMTQSASYAIQDFVQGLSVGSFSMAVRGAANNVETLAATMTMGSSAAVAMGASLIPTLALVGVSLYEIYGSSKKAKEGHDEAAEAAKRYKHALDQIKDANQSLAKSENERAEATHRRLYADATSDINKSLSEVREKINAYDANSFNAPRDFRKEAAEVDAFRANFEAGLKSGALPRGTTIENASNVTSDSQYIANVAMQEMMARVDSQRELLTKEAGLRGRLASVSAEETARRGRAVREQAMDAAGGKDKFVELAARGIRSGVPAGAIRAGLAIKFGAGADEDVDGIMRAAAAKAKKDEYESKDPIEKQRQAVKKLKDDHAGAFAVGEAEKKLHAMEADDKGVLATLERIAAFLGNIDAKTDAAPPQNNVNRNNANVLEGAARFMGWNL